MKNKIDIYEIEDKLAKNLEDSIQKLNYELALIDLKYYEQHKEQYPLKNNERYNNLKKEFKDLEEVFK
jgi:hypothetical protein